MGKGNRSRQDRAFEAVNTPEEASTKSLKFKTTVVTIIVAALLVCCILLSTVVNSGIILRAQTAAKTDNYSVNGTIMSYLIYSQAQSMVAMYQQYGMSTTVSQILSQVIDSETGKTYLDSFAESAFDQLKQMLTLCEYADKNGITMSEDDKKAIDEYMDSIAEEAAKNMYTTNGYLKLMYGNGVTANDIRKVLELNYLSNAAYEVLKEKLEGQITDEMLKKYLEENVDEFYRVDYLTYTFTAKLDKEGTTATDEEKAAYETEKKAMLALAEQLGEIKTEQGFKDFVRNYLVNTVASEEFDAAYEKDYKKKFEGESFAPTAEALAADKAALLVKLDEALKALDVEEEESEEEDEEDDKKEEEKNAYQKALDTIYASLLKTATSSYNGVTVEDKMHYDPEKKEDEIGELDKWLFDSETKVNDTKVITKEGDEKDKVVTSTYSVSLLKTASHIEEYVTKDVAHLLVSFDDYQSGKTITDAEKAEAKAEAEKLLAEFKKGEQTKEAFEKFAEEHTADSGVIYENVKLEQMVEPFEKWIYDETRKAGDTDIVETEYGYHVMYFIGDSELVAWEVDAKSAVFSDLFEDWVKTESENCNFSYKESVINTIK